ncbi:RarD protein [Luminiphilus syltensis NOR5-1B]|uniref:RarD protein n=1 Tax=Luminiphilus syltensis NOR5-1B TaxID=565045 RepID=B8KR11_9GAMM|nr:RarD protein [Luminiphilus syltensis NOR5-1B]
MFESHIIFRVYFCNLYEARSSLKLLSDYQRGICLSLTAHSIWGGAALYWMQTQPVSAVDVVAQRGLWTLPSVAFLLLLAGRLTGALALIRDVRTIALMALTGAIISVNWLTFIYAVTHGRAAEASFGYFLIPLFTVFVGIFALGERPTGLHLMAMGLVVVAILLQMVALGGLPLVSLGVSISFTLYSVVRKQIRADALQGLFWESIFIFCVAAPWVFLKGGSGLGEYGPRVDWFLVLSGFFTAAPLLTQVAASRLLPLTTVGLLSYLGPTLQLLVAVTLLGETISPTTIAAFGIVWVGLAAITLNNLRAFHRRRRLRKEEDPAADGQTD